MRCFVKAFRPGVFERGFDFYIMDKSRVWPFQLVIRGEAIAFTESSRIDSERIDSNSRRGLMEVTSHD